MSSQTAFPDAIVFPDGTIRLVTRAAKDFAYANTNIGTVFSLSTARAVPDYLAFDDTIPQMFEDESMTVKRERQPVGHYCGKRRTSLKAKSSNASEVEYDNHRARFEGLTLDEYRRQRQMCRAYGRHRARNWRLMQERDEKLKKSDLPEEKCDEIRPRK